MFGKKGCLGLKCKHQQSPQKHQEKHPEIAVVREFAAVPCIVWAVGRYLLQLRFVLLFQHNTRAKQQEEEHQVVTQLTDRAEAAETESKLLAEKSLGFVHRATCYLCHLPVCSADGLCFFLLSFPRLKAAEKKLLEPWHREPKAPTSTASVLLVVPPRSWMLKSELWKLPKRRPSEPCRNFQRLQSLMARLGPVAGAKWLLN